MNDCSENSTIGYCKFAFPDVNQTPECKRRLLLRNFLSPLLSGVSGLFGRFAAQKPTIPAKNFSTAVEDNVVAARANEATAIVVQTTSAKEKFSPADVASVSHAPIVRRRRLQVAPTDVLAVANVTPERGENKTKRFRRTKEEIRLGLSREQAMAKRGITITGMNIAVSVPMTDRNSVAPTDRTARSESSQGNSLSRRTCGL